MKKIVFLFAAFLLSLATYAQTTTDQTQDPTALTNALFKALLDEDGQKMMALTTNDFTITSFDGQIADRDLLSQAIGGGYLVVDAAATSDTKARLYNNDAAVVSGSSTFKGNLQGQAFNTNIVFNALCVKQGSGWKVASLQFSAAK